MYFSKSKNFFFQVLPIYTISKIYGKKTKKLFCYIEKTHSFQCQKYNKIHVLPIFTFSKFYEKIEKKRFSVISKKYKVFKVDQFFRFSYFINIYDHKFGKKNQK